MSVPSTPVRAKRQIKKKVYDMYDSEDDDFDAEDELEAQESGAKANAGEKATKKRKRADSDDEEFAAPEDVADDGMEDDDYEVAEAAEPAVESDDDLTETKTPPAKRAKTAAGRAGAPSKSKLSKKLKGLKREELIELVENLVDAHPELLNEIDGTIPQGDVDTYLADLQTLQNKVHRAKPHSRWGSDTDAYSYKRAKPATSEFRRKLQETITQVKNRGDWKFAATFFGKLVDLVRGLPHWDYNREEGALSMLKGVSKGIKMALSKKTVVLTDAEATKLFHEINVKESRSHMEEAIDALKTNMQKNKQGALWKQLQAAPADD
eukprot:TRINITY_DN3385_c0_g1_i1.p2 TRINITY_DN3385_c0_g1~~TRINITY_DN3385_c0_g1_i1.p2  ORF type:complete len:322 (+),score=121.29 TRINITY_DN3385_c0_g1_i1:283-1248(+)